MIIDNEFEEAGNMNAYTVAKTLEKMKKYIEENAIQGPQGETGPQGPNGAKGETGERGSLTYLINHPSFVTYRTGQINLNVFGIIAEPKINDMIISSRSSNLGATAKIIAVNEHIVTVELLGKLSSTAFGVVGIDITEETTSFSPSNQIFPSQSMFKLPVGMIVISNTNGGYAIITTNTQSDYTISYMGLTIKGIKGDTGPQGPNGAKGETGERGSLTYLINHPSFVTYRTGQINLNVFGIIAEPKINDMIISSRSSNLGATAKIIAVNEHIVTVELLGKLSSTAFGVVGIDITEETTSFSPSNQIFPSQSMFKLPVGMIVISNTNGGYAIITTNTQSDYTISYMGLTIKGIKGDTGPQGDKGDKGDDGIPEAPIDDKVYGRQNGEWTNINSLIDNAIEDVLLGEV